jgi:UTP--glucose-1-phosphate uridylyltransferase
VAKPIKVPDKAVIPAAGLGQRLSPITNLLPKEMFPIGPHPAIEWVVAEAVASGCTDVAVVINPQKQIIRDYLINYCPYLADLCCLRFLMQPEPYGLGHALLLAREFCDGNPFAVLLPDDLVKGPELPLLQMLEPFHSRGGVIFAATQEPAESARRYGRLQLRQLSEQVYGVERILDRATLEGSTPCLAGVGRYLLPPEFLGYAARLWDQPRKGEFDDALILQHMLAMGEPVYAMHIRGQRYDISTTDGYIAAWGRFGRERPKIREGENEHRYKGQ